MFASGKGHLVEFFPNLWDAATGNLGEIPGQAGDGAFQVGWSSSTFGSLEFSS